MINNVFNKLLEYINLEQDAFNTLINADNTLGLNVTVDDIYNYLEFTNTDKLLSNNIMGNIIITEGDVLSVLKLIHDLVYYNGEYILFINDDNRGIITYLVKRANQIYNELGINVNLKIDYNKNYNSYINNAVTIIGSNDFVNTACKDFTNYNIIVA